MVFHFNEEMKKCLKKDKNVSHVMVLNCGTIFHLKLNHPKLIKYSKNIRVSRVPSANADSLFLVLFSITLICWMVL